MAFPSKLRWAIVVAIALLVGYISLYSSLTADVMVQHSYTEAMMPSSDMRMGFSVGGAKDINNFRANINNGFLPQLEDLTYEGLFYDYYFDTEGQVKEECTKLFCPTYAVGISNDPVVNSPVYYLSVGLQSGMKETDLSRKKLNLVVVLDVSGSMSSPFDMYYYDGKSNTKSESQYKIQVASESVIALMKHLNPDDRFGLVLFDTQATTIQQLELVDEIDVEGVKKRLAKIVANGGTSMEVGLERGTSLFDTFREVDTDVYENRMIFLTDAQPNTGAIGDRDLLKMTSENADNRIFTTFIGVGVDFNAQLIERITKIKGANYYSVHNAQEFAERMDEGFDYMVTPLVFDLELNMQSVAYKILKVYGSPEADIATGNIMRVNTLFPSKTVDGATKGGIILIQLARSKDLIQGTEETIELSVTYKNRKGEEDSSESVIIMPDRKQHYDTLGIRKAILLARYGSLMKHWIQNQKGETPQDMKYFVQVEQEGIPIVPDTLPTPNWERTSKPLAVDARYCRIMTAFLDYFRKEATILKDELLDKEALLVTKLQEIAC